MPKGIIITGFHRSGTSSLAQELHSAGLFIGYNLMKGGLSNQDGHFEDYSFVKIDEKIFSANKLEWDTIDIPKKLTITPYHHKRMQNLVAQRESTGSNWGFKDPRSILLLEEWSEVIKDYIVVAVYRHYDQTVASLKQRAAQYIVYDKQSDIKLWQKPDYGYKMWIEYNQRLIDFAKKSKRVVIVSHEALIEGFDIVTELNNRFGLDLQKERKRSIKRYIRSKHISSYIPDNQLLSKLQDTLNSLQQLSIAPIKESLMPKLSPPPKESIDKLQNRLLEVSKETLDSNQLLKKIQKFKEAKNKTLFAANYMKIFEESASIESLLHLLKDTDSTEAILLKSIIYTKLNKKDLALQILNSSNQAENPAIQKAKASLLIAMGEDKEAQDILDMVYDESNPYMVLTKAHIALYRCQYDKAKELYDTALRLSTNNMPKDMDFAIEVAIEWANTLFFELDTKAEEFDRYFKDIIQQYPSYNRLKSVYRWFKQPSNLTDAEIKRTKKELKKDKTLYKRVNNLLQKLPKEYQNELAYYTHKAIDQLFKQNVEFEVSYPIVSFVVDGNPKHYYEAELLLLSIEKFTQIPKKNIVVHTTNKVSKEFLNMLQSSGYKHIEIEPYLDKKYCNKIQQLNSFTKIADIEQYSIILLDCDTIVLQNLPVVTDGLRAKIVDAPNPANETITEIFKRANIKLPPLVETDYDLRGGKVVSGYYNGGFYAISGNYIDTINRSWRKWAEWLYSNQNELLKPNERMHIDQISMALALADGNIPHSMLPANYNAPTHRCRTLKTLDESKPITLLHHHGYITPFGTLSYEFSSSIAIENAISKINTEITKSPRLTYEAFKIDQTRQIEESDKEIAEFFASKAKEFDKEIKIILHCGTPKTGTTTLQFYLDKNREEFAKYGIYYPNRYKNTYAPKHQWIVGMLRRENYKELLKEFEWVFANMPQNCHTILLSTEGLYNHWSDFTPKALGFLKTLNRYFKVNSWVWFREPSAFIESLYRQNMKNIRLKGIPSYGRDRTLSELLDDSWFINHLDYLGFILDIQNLFGKESIKIFNATGDTIGALHQVLNINKRFEDVERKNDSLGCNSIEILKTINHSYPNENDKKKMVKELYNIDSILSQYDTKDICDTDAHYRIQNLFSLQRDILQKRFNLYWEKTEFKPTCFIVVGMHRSGTSSLMGSLESAGVYSGDVSKWNPHNIKGNREHFKIVEINEMILKYNNSSWDNPPQENIEWNSEHIKARDRVIQDFIDAKKAFVGFKDPRTLLTLPFWLEGLTQRVNIQFVGTYRHPLSVARSLYAREKMEQDKAISLWIEYNKKLLNLYQTKPFPLISFDLPPHRYIKSLNILYKELGLDSNNKEYFFDNSIRKLIYTPIDPISNSEAAKIYKELEYIR